MNLKKLEDLLLDLSKDGNYELVDFQVISNTKEVKLIVFIDNGGNITIEDCVKMNNLIDESKDIDNFFENSYILEVSSPGPNRPLKKLDDFQRYIGRKVKIKSISILDDGKNVFTGSIEKISDNDIEINDSGKLYKINLKDIEKANLNI